MAETVTPGEIIKEKNEVVAEEKPSFFKKTLTFAKEHPIEVVEGALSIGSIIVGIVYKVKTGKEEIKCWRSHTLNPTDKFDGVDHFK